MNNSDSCSGIFRRCSMDFLAINQERFCRRKMFYDPELELEIQKRRDQNAEISVCEGGLQFVWETQGQRQRRDAHLATAGQPLDASMWVQGSGEQRGAVQMGAPGGAFLGRATASAGRGERRFWNSALGNFSRLRTGKADPTKRLEDREPSEGQEQRRCQRGTSVFLEQTCPAARGDPEMRLHAGSWRPSPGPRGFRAGLSTPGSGLRVSPRARPAVTPAARSGGREWGPSSPPSEEQKHPGFCECVDSESGTRGVHKAQDVAYDSALGLVSAPRWHARFVRIVTY